MGPDLNKVYAVSIKATQKATTQQIHIEQMCSLCRGKNSQRY